VYFKHDPQTGPSSNACLSTNGGSLKLKVGTGSVAVDNKQPKLS
jgi:hypothetical protein